MPNPNIPSSEAASAPPGWQQKSIVKAFRTFTLWSKKGVKFMDVLWLYSMQRQYFGHGALQLITGWWSRRDYDITAPSLLRRSALSTTMENATTKKSTSIVARIMDVDAGGADEATRALKGSPRVISSSSSATLPLLTTPKPPALPLPYPCRRFVISLAHLSTRSPRTQSGSALESRVEGGGHVPAWTCLSRACQPCSAQTSSLHAPSSSEDAGNENEDEDEDDNMGKGKKQAGEQSGVNSGVFSGNSRCLGLLKGNELE
ncbi:hypothetical protein GGX14DRAFT_393441 [Mycena pura]|uniref:Uncharacterized protein n=1 Tax=Mycena pura TaxID=153505 RepID=A0AAD6VGZ9_9AGAR|nr:hypothetical protein GGX14DRAFT_393441 [Mycena pura]